ncbi:MAG: transglycosylase SLT domain-containing protein, partial [Gammaproteobacteria bacterium]
MPVLPLPEHSNPHAMLLNSQTGLQMGNLWRNLAGNFQIPREPHQPQIKKNIQWFTQNPDYLTRTTQRATPYMYLIYEQIQQRGLPADVALLPMIESAYYPYSYSGAGAAGLWQLMPGTAKDMGVKRTRFYDGRHDIFVSTHAALDYLVYLQKIFKNDWLLTIAAYDAGPGRVQKAINKNLGQGKPIDFWSLDLPEETQHYIPRFLALLNIIHNPEAYGITLPDIENQPYLARIDMGAKINLKEAARLANISLKDLKHLNPHYHQHLLLPIDKVDTFKKNLARATRTTQITWGHHKMQPGETLESIAQQYHTSVIALRKANTGNKTMLLIPIVTEVIGEASETIPLKIPSLRTERTRATQSS